MRKLKKVAIELIPFFVALVITPPLRRNPGLESEILIAVFYAALVFTFFMIRYKRQELKVFFVGFLAGIFVEGWGKILFLFSWQKFNSILPVPLYIPIVWGFGFVIMRRIGNIMMEKNGKKI